MQRFFTWPKLIFVFYLIFFFESKIVHNLCWHHDMNWRIKLSVPGHPEIVETEGNSWCLWHNPKCPDFGHVIFVCCLFGPVFSDYLAKVPREFTSPFTSLFATAQFWGSSNTGKISIFRQSSREFRPFSESKPGKRSLPDICYIITSLFELIRVHLARVDNSDSIGKPFSFSRIVFVTVSISSSLSSSYPG